MKKVILLIAIVFCCFKFSYSQSGKLDSSFGTNGIVTTNFESLPGLSQFRSTAVQADGKVVAGGITTIGSKSYLVLARYNTDGSLDKSFSGDGKVTVDSFSSVSSTPVSLALQKDEKIVVAASAIFRFNTDGSLDITFSGDGMENISFGSARDQSQSLAIQKDGKIVVGGTTFNETNNSNDFSVARYNTDGSVDNTFSGDGKLKTDISKLSIVSDDNTQSIMIQSDGKIVLAGNSTAKQYDPEDSSIYFTLYYYTLVRYNIDGTLDNNFNGNGILTSAVTYESGETATTYVRSTALQDDGKILVASTIIDVPGLIRYNKDGSVDNDFGPYGQGYTNLPFSYGRLTNHEDLPISVQSDGKIVTGSAQIIYSSSSYSYSVDFKLARHNIDGSTDNTFNGDGVATTNVSGGADFIYSIVTSGNKIYAAGSASDTAAIVSYTLTGKLNTSYGNNGIVKTNFESGRRETHYNSTAIQTDGKIVAVGSSFNGTSNNFAIARYNPDSSLDNTFSEDGKQTTKFGVDQSATANSVAIQKDEKIVVVGSNVVGINTYQFAVSRYYADGSLDNSFNDNGTVTTFGDDRSARATSVAIQRDGKIVVVGTSNNPYPSQLTIVRYNTDGSLDPTFNANVKKTTNEGTANFVLIQNDGKIVVVGSPIARFNADGSLDKTFGDNGTKYLYQFAAYSGVLQADGKIVVAGDRGEYPFYKFALARLKTDGNLDSTFAENGIQITDFKEYPFSKARSVVLQDNGKVLVGGNVYLTYTTDTDFGLARYNTNGSLDTKFSEDGLQITKVSSKNDEIASIAISNNKLYAAGTSGESGNSGTVARYLLDENENKPPTVSLSIPYNIIKYTAPARIKLNTAATDKDGTITNVRFYNGTTKLHTETEFPYGFLWINVPIGNYTLTAKAFDNSGNVTTSNAINVSVVEENVPPVVSIVSPVDDTTYTGPATIRLIANAKDPNDRISKVELYNGTTLLRTEYYYPYTYPWSNVQPGTYTITAKAYDDQGLSATSDPVTVTVMNASIVSRPSSAYSKTDLNGALSLQLSPNPARSTLQIYTKGLQLNKRSTISVLSASGVVMKTIQSNASDKVVQLDVSSMVNGVYTIKVVSGNKVAYKQFVKV